MTRKHSLRLEVCRPRPCGYLGLAEHHFANSRGEVDDVAGAVVAGRNVNNVVADSQGDIDDVDG